MASSSTGTIDITDVVESLRQSFVTWGTAYIISQELAVPGLQWLGFPIISQLNSALTKAILNLITKSAVMEAFFINTAIRKASQAQDYVDAIDAKNSLPADASTETIQKAEQAEMDAFKNFVMVTN